MSLSPVNMPESSSGSASPESPAAANPRSGHRKIWTICFILLALEIGGFLVVFPWMEAWRLNHFRALFPSLSAVWEDPYFRGAITGLGAVNLLVAIGQTVHLFRPSRSS